MQTNKHEYAEILHAIAEGKQIQQCYDDCGWEDEHWQVAFDVIRSGIYPPDKFRVKPKTININGFEVPEPEREELACGVLYFVPAFASYSYGVRNSWQNDYADKHYLENGLVHLTREAADLHAKALLSFTKIGD